MLKIILLGTAIAVSVGVMPTTGNAKRLVDTIGEGWAKDCKSSSSSHRSCCRKKREACEGTLCTGAEKVCNANAAPAGRGDVIKTRPTTAQ